MLNKFRILIRGFAWWILGSVKPTPDEVDKALLKAFGDCGLNKELYSPEFDVLHSGKLHEVIVHASRNLGNPLVTVNDLKELLG